MIGALLKKKTCEGDKMHPDQVGKCHKDKGLAPLYQIMLCNPPPTWQWLTNRSAVGFAVSAGS